MDEEQMKQFTEQMAQSLRAASNPMPMGAMVSIPRFSGALGSPVTIHDYMRALNNAKLLYGWTDDYELKVARAYLDDPAASHVANLSQATLKDLKSQLYERFEVPLHKSQVLAMIAEQYQRQGETVVCFWEKLMKIMKKAYYVLKEGKEMNPKAEGGQEEDKELLNRLIMRELRAWGPSWYFLGFLEGVPK